MDVMTGFREVACDRHSRFHCVHQTHPYLNVFRNVDSQLLTIGGVAASTTASKKGKKAGFKKSRQRVSNIGFADPCDGLYMNTIYPPLQGLCSEAANRRYIICDMSSPMNDRSLDPSCLPQLVIHYFRFIVPFN